MQSVSRADEEYSKRREARGRAYRSTYANPSPWKLLSLVRQRELPKKVPALIFYFAAQVLRYLQEVLHRIRQI